MKVQSILAASLLALSGSAVAGEPVELTANQMDGVTAGAASGLEFSLNALGSSTALTQINAMSMDEVLGSTTVQLTTVTQTGSGVGASGTAQAMGPVVIENGDNGGA